jgi:acyl dehydratase
MYCSSHAIYNTPDVTWAFQGGVLEWNAKFHLLVRAGEVLQDKLTILSTTPSRKPTRGIVKDIHEMMNQKGERVFLTKDGFSSQLSPQ